MGVCCCHEYLQWENNKTAAANELHLFLTLSILITLILLSMQVNYLVKKTLFYQHYNHRNKCKLGFAQGGGKRGYRCSINYLKKCDSLYCKHTHIFTIEAKESDCASFILIHLNSCA